MTDRFHHEDDIQAAYDSAELVVQHLVSTEKILLVDYRPGAVSRQVKEIAHKVADAVIRSNAELGDISEIPGVKIERVS